MALWHALLLLVDLTSTASSLMCFMCGPSTDGSPQGGCRSQFQYECSPATLRMPDYQGRILCRSTRIMDAGGSYTFSKECVTEDDHFLAYPDNVGQTCFQPYANSTICVCGTNLCNGLTVAQQMSAAFQPVRADAPEPASTLGQQPVAEFKVNANLDYLTGNGEYVQVQPRPLGPSFQLPAQLSNKHLVQVPNKLNQYHGVEETQPPTIPTRDGQPTTLSQSTMQHVFDTTTLPEYIDPQANPNLLLPIDTNPEQTLIAVDHESIPDHVTMHKEEPMPTKPTIAFNQDGTTVNFEAVDVAGVSQIPRISNRFQNLTSLGAFIPQTYSAEPLSCILCTEASANEDAQCQNYETSQCNIPNMKGPEYLRCLTRRTKLADGNSALEKFCVDLLDLASEYGPSINTSESSGCYSAAEGLVRFCLCSERQCNAQTLIEQITENGGVVKEIGVEPREEGVGKLKGANFCKRCIRSNMNTPSECESLMDVNCSQQYRNDTEVYCLTRMIKNASGLYSIERRCVSKSDHEKGYPGTRVVHEGCGEAWNGHVQYCVCKDDHCNQGSLTDQQARIGFNPTQTDKLKPEPNPDPEPTKPKPEPEPVRPEVDSEPKLPPIRPPKRPFVREEPKKAADVPQWRRFGNTGTRNELSVVAITMSFIVVAF